MNETLLIILIIIGTGAVIMLIKYLIYKLFDKGADAIRNKMADKRNRENPGPESLADKYKNEVPSVENKVEPEVPHEEAVTPEEVEETVESTVEETIEEPAVEEKVEDAAPVVEPEAPVAETEDNKEE